MTFCDIATSHQPKNNVETTLKIKTWIQNWGMLNYVITFPIQFFFQLGFTQSFYLRNCYRFTNPTPGILFLYILQRQSGFHFFMNFLKSDKVAIFYISKKKVPDNWNYKSFWSFSKMFCLDFWYIIIRLWLLFFTRSMHAKILNARPCLTLNISKLLHIILMHYARSMWFQTFPKSLIIFIIYQSECSLAESVNSLI